MNCSATLTPIAQQCGRVLGGISKFYVINRDDVASITVSQGAVTNITLENSGSDTHGFISYGFRRNTANVVVTGNADDAGRNISFTTVVTLEFAKPETAKRVSLMSFIESDCYGIYEDANHKRWLIGYDAPLQPNVNAESGSAPTDKAQYVLVCQDNSLELPYEVTMSDEAFEALLDENL